MKHIRIGVKLEDFKSYQEKYGHNRLDKWYRIDSVDSHLPKFLKINEEIFEGRETKYEIVESNNKHYLMKFTSSSNTEYRFDIFRENITNIWHLGFSLLTSNLDSDYHKLTDKKESIDVFSKIIWILKDLDKLVEADEYCIGMTGDKKKDNIYQYMMRFVTGWERRESEEYDLGWAIYFKI